ncbi:MAG: hypothetical protein V5A33_06555 [Halobacteriales archaeon]
MSEPCEDCGTPISDALARTVRLTVDRSQVDAQRLCPACFADWIERYRTEMQSETESGPTTIEDGDDDIIVD